MSITKCRKDEGTKETPRQTNRPARLRLTFSRFRPFVFSRSFPWTPAIYTHIHYHTAPPASNQRRAVHHPVEPQAPTLQSSAGKLACPEASLVACSRCTLHLPPSPMQPRIQPTTAGKRQGDGGFPLPRSAAYILQESQHRWLPEARAADAFVTQPLAVEQVMRNVFCRSVAR